VSSPQTLCIGDFCKTGSGSTPSRSQFAKYYEGGTIPWIKSGELREGVILEAEEHVTDAALTETSIKLVPKGAILLAMYGATVGRLALLGIQATTNQAVCHIIPDPNIADTRYLFHALSSQVPAIVAMGVGGAQPNISQGVVKSLKIWLPALPEQRCIAAILDKADALRAKRREALAQLDRLAQSIFVEMFGDSSAYDQRPLQDLCELITDGTHQTPTYAEEGVIFLSAKNVTSGEIDWQDIKFIPQSLHAELYRRLAPRRGDVLLAKNGTTGVAAIVDRDEVFDIYVSLALLRPKAGVLPEYLHAAVNSASCKRQFTGSLKGIGVPNLHLKDIRQSTVPYPAAAEQERFVGRLRGLSLLKESARSALVSTNALFSVLQARAFQGEL
jgi:type I restriction enzyme, S subunit